MEILITIIIIVVVLVIAAFAQNSSDNSYKEAQAEKSGSYAKRNNINVDAEFSYTSFGHRNHVRCIVDNKNKKLCIMWKDRMQLPSEDLHSCEIEFSNIIGCEVLIDSKVAGAIGRAFVGGIIGGDSGAVVGAMTAKKYIMSYDITIHCDNVISPQITIPLISEKTSTEVETYREANEFSNRLSATIKAIMALNSR